ncbi:MULTISPECIES: hypothetical protein [Jannaschia]|nr:MULTISPECIES: hypothetical protein [unclassified Jannaschia]
MGCLLEIWDQVAGVRRAWPVDGCCPVFVVAAVDQNGVPAAREAAHSDGLMGVGAG